MPRIETYFDEMIKSLTLANLNLIEAVLENQDDLKSWFFYERILRVKMCKISLLASFLS